MTLNITLVTPVRIYQSADFLLYNTATQQVVSETSTKLIELQHKEFFGFVTYTGVGSFRDRSTAEYVLDWLKTRQGLSIGDVAKILAKQGTRWIEQIERVYGKRYKHTFVVAGYSAGQPAVAVVSNFEDGINQPAEDPRNRLSTVLLKPIRRSKALVTGIKEAVTRERRRNLERLSDRYPNEPARIRQAMSAVNGAAAQSRVAGRRISADCTVASIEATGRGFQHIDETSNVTAYFVMEGFVSRDLFDMLKKQGIIDGPARVKGRTSARSQSSQDVSILSCIPVIAPPEGAPEYEVVILPADDSLTSTARSISDEQYVLGAINEATNPSAHIYSVWDNELNLKKLGYYSLSSIGCEIVDQRHFACTLLADDLQSSRAARFRNEEVTDLGTFRGLDSGVHAMNRSGEIAGWVCTDPKERSQRDYRPARWSADNTMTVLTDNADWDWGYAIDINTVGTCLLFLYSGPRVLVRRWHSDGIVEDASPASGRVIPLAINDRGTILAFSYDSNGQPVAGHCDSGNTWLQLGTPPGFLPRVMNNAGVVAGSVMHEGFHRPWILSTSGDLAMPSYLRYHGCTPLAINETDVLVGEGTVDHGSHALTWRPVQPTA
jgi:hypothetical protein